MKKIITLLLGMALVFTLVACSGTTQPTSQGEQSTPQASPLKLVIGVDDTYPPMEFRNDSNELVGFDIDFANALAKELGVEIEFVATAWDGIFTGLTTGKYDCIISSVSITEERLQSYTFSKPYLSNGQVIVVKKGDTSIKSPEDLKDKNVGVQLETTADIAAKKQQEVTPFQLTQYDDIIQTFADLKTGRLQAIVVDYAVAIEYCSKDVDNFEITTAQLTNEPIAVCMKKDADELKAKVDAAITKLQEDGTMKEISNKWLGDDYVSDINEELR